MNYQLNRGFHFQVPPFDQGKLVRIVKGSAIDVAVDLRKNSSTYGEYHKILLSEKKQNMFWIPSGFAHGFVVLEKNTFFVYKCTNYYDKNSERCIIWNDKDLNIDWEINTPILWLLPVKERLLTVMHPPNKLDKI